MKKVKKGFLTTLTRHAVVRLQQRGKSWEAVRLVLRYGVREGGRDGVMVRRKELEKQIEQRKRWLSRLAHEKKRLRKSMHRRIKTLERIDGFVVIEKENRILTAFNRTRRPHRG